MSPLKERSPWGSPPQTITLSAGSFYLLPCLFLRGGCARERETNFSTSLILALVLPELIVRRVETPARRAVALEALLEVLRDVERVLEPAAVQNVLEERQISARIVPNRRPEQNGAVRIEN